MLGAWEVCAEELGHGLPRATLKSRSVAGKVAGTHTLRVSLV